MDQDDDAALSDLPTDPPVVVHGVQAGRPPSRRVEIRHQAVGRAFSIEDVTEFLRRAGLEDADPRDPELVAWHDGGPDLWTAEAG